MEIGRLRRVTGFARFFPLRGRRTRRGETSRGVHDPDNNHSATVPSGGTPYVFGSGTGVVACLLPHFHPFSSYFNPKYYILLPPKRHFFPFSSFFSNKTLVISKISFTFAPVKQ